MTSMKSSRIKEITHVPTMIITRLLRLFTSGTDGVSFVDGAGLSGGVYGMGVGVGVDVGGSTGFLLQVENPP